MQISQKNKYFLIMLISFVISFIPFKTREFNSFCEDFYSNITFNLLPSKEATNYLVIQCPRITLPRSKKSFSFIQKTIKKLSKLKPDFIILDTDPLITKSNPLFNQLNRLKIPLITIAPDRKFKKEIEKKHSIVENLTNSSFIINQKENLEIINFVNDQDLLSVSSLINFTNGQKNSNRPYQTKIYFKDQFIKELSYFEFIRKKLEDNTFKGKTVLIKTGFPSSLDKPFLTNIGIQKATTLLFNDIETKNRGDFLNHLPTIKQKIILLLLLFITLFFFIKLKILFAIFCFTFFINIQIICYCVLFYFYQIQLDYFSLLFTQLIFSLITVGLELRNINIIQETLEEYTHLKKNVVMQNKAILSLKKMSELGRLTSGINHEISNPLHNIYNSLNLLKLEETLNDESKETLDIAISEIMRLQKLTKNLKQFSQPVCENKTEININNILKFSLKLLGPSFKSYEIKVLNNFIDKDLMIFADPDKIQQVFINILLNSCDVLKNSQNGIIKISTFEKDKSAIIVIKDNGPGISDQVRSDIFQEFFTTKGTQGSGLGLYVSYEIINNLSGDITISRNNKHTGAEFIIKIPIY